MLFPNHGHFLSIIFAINSNFKINNLYVPAIYEKFAVKRSLHFCNDFAKKWTFENLNSFNLFIQFLNSASVSSSLFSF